MPNIALKLVEPKVSIGNYSGSEVVQFPYIQETFQRAMLAGLNYFVEGGVSVIGQESIDFIACEIVFDRHILKEPLDRPTIAILGTRMSNEKRYHFTDPHINPDTGQPVRPFGWMLFSDVLRTFYVKVPRDGSDPTRNNKRQVDQIWDQLVALFATQQDAWRKRNIHQPWLTTVPVEIESKSHAILMGNFRATIEVPYATD